MSEVSPSGAGRRGALLGLILTAAGAVVMLWFLAKIVTAMLLLFFALVVAIALSAGVRWFEGKGMPRRPAAALTLLLFFAVLTLIAALVIPRLATQLVLLVNSLPQILIDLNDQVSALLARYPDLQPMLAGDEEGGGQDLGGAAIDIFRGGLGLSLEVLGAVALLIVFFSSVLYVVLDPRPILRGYLGSFPRRHRPAAMRAYRRAARAVVGWTEASLVIGAIEFVLVFFFLSWIGMTAVLVWAALAFFSEFIPRIGGYLMAFPPVVIALTMGPMTALWVALFYLAMNEILGNFLAPRIRGTTMQLHPVMLLFFTLAFALAFGLLGAIVATPAAAFFAAFYSEFYMKRPLRRAALAARLTAPPDRAA